MQEVRVQFLKTFSSILIPPKPSGEGGVVSIDYNPRTRMASYDINLEGVAQSALPLTSKLSGKWRVAKRRYRKQLARGRLRMRITFSDGRRLTGSIQPRLMCGVFQAVLTSGQTVDKKRTSSAGSAVIQIGEDGSLDYKIRVANMENDVTRLRLQTASSKENRKSRLVGNLKRKYVSDTLDKSSGWANGTYKRLGAEDVFRLLNNQLYISVATGKPRRAALRGRLVNTEYHEHFKKEGMALSYELLF
ncbi:chordin-like [Aplysia californica]|uniref:Chordin-like n=1 Tax=Aplysia californica TaxID=6500 RepID=A0ABM1A9Z0_APLCA|nr:chordin-like [Aplysia californica]